MSQPSEGDTGTWFLDHYLDLQAAVERGCRQSLAGDYEELRLDAQQEAMLRLWRHRKKVRRKGNPVAYAFTTGRNTGHTLRRRAERRLEVTFGQGEEMGTVVASEDLVVLPALDDGIDARSFFEEQVLPRLSPRQREILPYILQGCTNAEIARKLGVTRAAITPHVQKIREVLQALRPGRPDGNAGGCGEA